MIDITAVFPQHAGSARHTQILLTCDDWAQISIQTVKSRSFKCKGNQL